jgi:hypothetical protein
MFNQTKEHGVLRHAQSNKTTHFLTMLNQIKEHGVLRHAQSNKTTHCF